MRGTWGVAGTDPDQVERIVRDVSGMLAGEGAPKGMGGWLGLAGRLLGGALAGGAGAAGEDHEKEEAQEAHRRDGSAGRSGRSEANRIGYGGSGSEVSRDGRGKGRRSIDDQGYNDDDLVDEEDDTRNYMRRRRRRRRRDVD